MITSVTKVYYDNVHVAYDMVKNSETSSVPLDEANTDYQEIQQWISEGNTVIDNGE
jgi:hypothetical protein